MPHEKSELRCILQALLLPSSNGQCKGVLWPYDPEKAKADEEREQAAVAPNGLDDPRICGVLLEHEDHGMTGQFAVV